MIPYEITYLLGVITIMKIGKYFIALLIYILLSAGVSINSFASNEAIKTYLANDQSSSGRVDHTALARQHEHLAKEMRAKAQKKEEILRTKPSTSFFGKNGKYLKSRIVNKIRNYEQVAQENLEKAAYHRTIASEQASRKYVEDPIQIDSQINKVKVKSNGTNEL